MKKEKNKKVLITGGAGFIGSHVADLLIEKGHKVIIIDDFSTGRKENINEKAEFYKRDISSRYASLAPLFAGIDCVFHLAARPRVVRSIKDPRGTNRVNVDGTLYVLQACREHKVKKVIYSSSSSVYGDQNDYLMKETMQPKPKSPYALQKLIGEHYCDLFARLFKMKIISLRYFNVYGPRQLTEGAYALVIGKFLRQKREGKPMTIYGDGKQTRAYTHVFDVARANLLAWKNDPIKASFYHYPINIGTSKETSVNEIVEMISGKKKYIIPNPRGEFEEKRKAANNTRAKKLLGWEPEIAIKEDIKTVL